MRGGAQASLRLDRSSAWADQVWLAAKPSLDVIAVLECKPFDAAREKSIGQTVCYGLRAFKAQSSPREGMYGMVMLGHIDDNEFVHITIIPSA